MNGMNVVLTVVMYRRDPNILCVCQRRVSGRGREREGASPLLGAAYKQASLVVGCILSHTT